MTSCCLTQIEIKVENQPIEVLSSATNWFSIRGNETYNSRRQAALGTLVINTFLYMSFKWIDAAMSQFDIRIYREDRNC